MSLTARVAHWTKEETGLSASLDPARTHTALFQISRDELRKAAKMTTHRQQSCAGFKDCTLEKPILHYSPQCLGLLLSRIFSMEYLRPLRVLQDPESEINRTL